MCSELLEFKKKLILDEENKKKELCTAKRNSEYSFLKFLSNETCLAIIHPVKLFL